LLDSVTNVIETKRNGYLLNILKVVMQHSREMSLEINPQGKDWENRPEGSWRVSLERKQKQ
jgi:hypothetical protein